MCKRSDIGRVVNNRVALVDNAAYNRCKGRKWRHSLVTICSPNHYTWINRLHHNQHLIIPSLLLISLLEFSSCIFMNDLLWLSPACFASSFVPRFENQRATMSARFLHFHAFTILEMINYNSFILEIDCL